MSEVKELVKYLSQDYASGTVFCHSVFLKGHYALIHHAHSAMGKIKLFSGKIATSHCVRLSMYVGFLHDDKNVLE